MYGGAAGGGKTDALLMAALQHVDVPGYAALLFRRTYQDLALPGAVMDRSHEWLRGSAARWSEVDHRWTFPSGATLTFGYLQSENDKFRYQGAECQFCVVRGTPVLMADDTWKPIEMVNVGDMVATLEGPCPVTAVHCPGRKPVCDVRTAEGSVTVGATHRLLLASGGWGSPQELLSMESHSCDSSDVGSWPTLQEPHTPGACSPRGRAPTRAPSPQSAAGTDRLGYAASSTGGRIGSATSAGGCAEAEPSQTWCGWIAALGRAFPSAATAYSDGHGGHCAPSLRDSSTGCQTDLRCGDERTRQDEAAGQCDIPPQGGVATRTRTKLRTGGRVNTPERSHRRYAHPYTNELRDCVEDVRPARACMAPAGEAEVFDLTVSCASHYIVSPGVIAQNCGFDELTQFKESQYLYLFSRLRRLEGSSVPIKMRAATNPGGVGHEWVRQRFIDPPDEPDRVFVPARLSDNPYLDSGEYMHSLDQLDAVTRAQLLDGNWDVMPEGDRFRREWFGSALAERPAFLSHWVRYFDKAGTEGGGDYTAGVLMGRAQGLYFVLDVVRGQWSPAQRNAVIRQTVMQDAMVCPRYSVWVEQEPGSGGKESALNTVTELAGYDAHAETVTGTKVVRANPFAAQCEVGNVKLIAGAWNADYLNELCAFPEGPHDDQVDASSGAFAKLATVQHETGSVRYA